MGHIYYNQSLETETLGVRQTSILFTTKNKIGFLGIDGKASQIFCTAEPDSRLVSAHVDSLSSGHVYGLSDDGYLYVFKTSNLLQSPEATDCYLDTKFKVAESAKSMVTVKGGIVIDTEQGSFYLNASTFMINRFARSAQYELPKPKPCPFGTDIYEFKT